LSTETIYRSITEGEIPIDNRSKKRKYYKKIPSNRKKAVRKTKNESSNHSNIHNLSSYKLTAHETKILEKGLNYVIANNKEDHIEQNLNYIDKLNRNMQLKLYFDTHNKISTNVENKNLGKPKIEYIKIPSSWNPPEPYPEIESFCNKLKYGIKVINNKHRNIPNLSQDEIKAIYSLRKNSKIIIKAADKGGGVTIMNTHDYDNKMKLHLDIPAYLKLENSIEYDPNEILNQYLLLIMELKPFLSKKQYIWLYEAQNEKGIIYGLPKIHKKEVPIRPIISQVKSLTNRLHRYIQQLLKIGELQIPNIIKDTTDFINKLNTYIPEIREKTYLITLDVESLYTNIPIEWGIAAIIEHYTETLKCWCCYDIDIKPIPPRLLKKSLEFALQNCFFTYNNNTYRQLHGLTMGGSSSVQAANIVMYKFFQKFDADQRMKITNYNAWNHHRFIDDLFGIWNKPITEFHEYFKQLNNFHKNFRFTLNFSLTDIPFLDVKIIKSFTFNNWTLKTTLYTKPTDKKLYLDFNSEHALHIKNSIPFSQMLRLKRIISDQINLTTELEIMTDNFIKRNYPANILAEARQKLDKIIRNDLLKYKIKEPDPNNLILVQIYQNKFALNQRLKKLVKNLWQKLIISYPYFRTVWPKPPIIAYKNTKSIKNLITSSKFPAPWLIKNTKNYNIEKIDELNLECLTALMNEG